MEYNFLDHIDTGMWIMFALGILSIVTFSWKTPDSEKGVKKYFRLTFKNVVFHIIASLMVFLALGEIGGRIIENWFPAMSGNGTYNMMLSGLTGMFGSALVALIIEKSKNFSV